jgi:hypothetical protein
VATCVTRNGKATAELPDAEAEPGPRQLVKTRISAATDAFLISLIVGSSTSG